MKMNYFGATGATMKRFAKFIDLAPPEHIRTLGAVLKAYDKSDGTNLVDFEDCGIPALSRHLARATADSMTDERALEFWGLGYMFTRLVYKLALHGASKEELDQLELLFSHAYDVGPDDSIKVSMERIVRGGHHAVCASLFKRHADQLAPKGEPAESPANLSESLDAAEPDEEEVTPETNILKRKFDEFKEACSKPIHVTLQVWNPIEGTSDDGINLTEAEFTEVLDIVRKMRAGYELAPDPDLIEATVSAFRNAEASVRLRKKEVQPKES